MFNYRFDLLFSETAKRCEDDVCFMNTKAVARGHQENLDVGMLRSIRIRCRNRTHGSCEDDFALSAEWDMKQKEDKED